MLAAPENTNWGLMEHIGICLAQGYKVPCSQLQLSVQNEGKFHYSENGPESGWLVLLYKNLHLR
jgi:hypothetical protein